MRAVLPPLLVCALLLAGCGPDEGQAALCERVVTVLEGNDGVTLLGSRKLAGDDAAVAIRYRLGAAGAPERTVVCRFAGAGIGAGRLRLVGVRRNDGTSLSRLSLGRLRARLNIE